MTVQGRVQRSRSAVANELDIRDIDAPYLLTSGSAGQETTKALDIGKLRHRVSPCARCCRPALLGKRQAPCAPPADRAHQDRQILGGDSCVRARRFTGTTTQTRAGKSQRSEALGLAVGNSASASATD